MKINTKHCPFSKMQSLLSGNSLRGGFTLIELMVAIGVAAVLGTFGIAGFSNYNQTQVLQTSANEVLTMLNLAKSRAQSQIKPSTACASVALASYSVVISSTEDYSLYINCSDDTQSEEQKKSLPPGLKFLSTDDHPFPISFFFPVLKGGVETPDNIVICNSAGGTSAKTITVSSLGDVSMKSSTCAYTPVPTVTPLPTAGPALTPAPTSMITVTPTPGVFDCTQCDDGDSSTIDICTGSVCTHSSPLLVLVSVSPDPSVIGKITWTVSASGALGTGSYSYSWTGDDGLSAITPSVSHTYKTQGLKTATVTVFSGSATKELTATYSVFFPAFFEAGVLEKKFAVGVTCWSTGGHICGAIPPASCYPSSSGCHPYCIPNEYYPRSHGCGGTGCWTNESNSATSWYDSAKCSELYPGCNQFHYLGDVAGGYKYEYFTTTIKCPAGFVLQLGSRSGTECSESYYGSLNYHYSCVRANSLVFSPNPVSKDVSFTTSTSLPNMAGKTLLLRIREGGPELSCTDGFIADSCNVNAAGNCSITYTPSSSPSFKYGDNNLIMCYNQTPVAVGTLRVL